ncbi:hypothetical protein FS837_005746 [Tulasnella sp. UAMH 9824]|nr:hypothetical protein FS837_005746 [Tulasnella sp. UAMH 9824]
MPYAQQEPQARHQLQQPYPSPPPTMQAFQHSLPPPHQQQLPPLSSIVPQSSPFSSHHRLQQQQRVRTKSSGAAVARQHLPAVQPMLQADRPSHHTSAFAYPSYGQPGPSSQAKASTSAMPTPSNGNVNNQQQQQARAVNGRQQQQHLVPTNHTPESGRTSRIANFVAHNTCAMICYIWFADPRPLTPSSENPPSSSDHADTPSSNPYSPSFPAPQSNPTSARLQFCPTKQFVDFMHTLLTTTQVSQGVIVLSLCYIFRLKRQNPGIVAQPGSELRLAVVGLMLANKFLDDNTYTNLTWSQIAKIPLADINNMEREFLGGLGHQLFIDQKAYEGWLLMLNGLMWAKERAYDGWRRMMYGSAQASAMVTSTERGRNGASLVLAQATPTHRPHIHALPRARSTSPIPTTAPASAFPFTFTLPPLQQPSSNPFSAATTPTRPHTQHHQQLPPPQPQTQLQPPPIPTATRPTTAGSKRTLGDASFSPDLKPPPAKRPLSGSFAALADYAMGVAQPQQQQQQPPKPQTLQPLYVATTAYPPPQQQQYQTAQPAPSSYRIPSASEMLGIESHSTASSDDSRASSGVAEMLPSMVTIGGNGYADGSGELRAALGRMSLEPSAARGQQDMVMVKQEEFDDVEEEEDEEEIKEEQVEDEDMLPSHVRGESVVEHLIAPYHADEKMVLRGLPQYLTYHTLAASPSVMVDNRQQAQQPVPAQSQAVVIPPPASAQEAHHAFGARDRGKTITRVQVNNFPVQHIQPPYMPPNSAANTTAFSIAPAGRSASFAHLGSRSARTSPTGLGFGSGVRGGFAGGMDVDSFAPRHVSQPQRQVSMWRVQQPASYATAQQTPSTGSGGHPRLPPLQTQHIIPPPATAAATTTASNNQYHQPSHSHYASSPYANNHAAAPAASYVSQPQGNFANAGPPGYQWPTNGSNGFFASAAPNGSGLGGNNGYPAQTAAAVATPVHPFGDHHHHYAPQTSQYGHQHDARWGYQQTQHLAQGQQAM